MKLTKDFYQRSALEVAPDLLGKLLVHQTAEGRAAGMIVEAEAYIGEVDKASHAYECRSVRTEVMYQAGGLAYVYLIYGMYHCFNVVTGPEDQAEAVLIRALEPVEGLELMQRRRGAKVKVPNLTSGPGKLCQALAITKAQYGMDLTGTALYLENYRKVKAAELGISTRINVDYAEEAKDFPWRFYLRGNKFVSAKPR